MSESIGKALERCLRVNFVDFAGSGGAVRVETVAQDDWASVTFSGARHRVRITLDGQGATGAAADFLAVMSDVELPTPGHIVADLSLRADARSDSGDHAWLELDILTVEDEDASRS